ncbi:hypothetical protein FAES_1855 [Fibrella aestuarina BUZ 2]|uniref:Uncharacterized protein n=1 Tax=Fibrella aestuarina BUZ 2 TaxID=1166018 RepID=I0K6W2_9BACT|nr:hypothetical protein [Fibrella aestuarina]CCG99865.1 hypothetical protein FAES_1855 [Fibrella aestuarina BUZ 2]
MITDQQFKRGSRVRVTVTRRGIHIRNYNATFVSWSPSGNAYLMADDGKHKTVSAESCKLIKQ